MEQLKYFAGFVQALQNFELLCSLHAYTCQFVLILFYTCHMNSFEWHLPRIVFILPFPVIKSQVLLPVPHALLYLRLFIFLVSKGVASLTSCKQLVQLFDQNLTKLKIELNSPAFLRKGEVG